MVGRIQNEVSLNFREQTQRNFKLNLLPTLLTTSPEVHPPPHTHTHTHAPTPTHPPTYTHTHTLTHIRVHTHVLHSSNDRFCEYPLYYPRRRRQPHCNCCHHEWTTVRSSSATNNNQFNTRYRNMTSLRSNDNYRITSIFTVYTLIRIGTKTPSISL